MKKQKSVSRSELYDKIIYTVIQLESMAHFLSQYTQKDIIPPNSAELFWGFGSIIEKKLKRIRKLVSQLEEQGH